MFHFSSNSNRLKNGKRGFSLVELIVVILIIAILAVAVFAGGSAAIKKAQKARAISDLHNFQIAVAMTMNENPQIANIEAATKKDKLSAIMNALNANLPADYKVTLQTAAMTGNISMAAQADENADFIICKSEKTDAWDNPYFVIIDSAQRGGSAASEFYMTTLTAGPNAILNLDGSVDKDDIFELTSYSDGDVISATYDVSDAVPTVVGGAAAATSYTDPAAAPVNNGISVDPASVPALISFTCTMKRSVLNNQSFTAQIPIGMTWEELINSDYNSFVVGDYTVTIDYDSFFDGSFPGWRVNGDPVAPTSYVCPAEGGNNYSNHVSLSDVIINNSEYLLCGINSGG